MPFDVALVLTEESLLVLLLIAGLLRAIAGPFPDSTDCRAVLEYTVLVAALSALTPIPVAPGIEFPYFTILHSLLAIHYSRAA